MNHFKITEADVCKAAINTFVLFFNTEMHKEENFGFKKLTSNRFYSEKIPTNCF